MTQAVVTIIINYFNTPQYLNTALKSCLDQTYDALEVLVYDNGSTPPVNELITDSIDDPRLVIHRRDTNIPLGDARKSAIAISKGSFIIFLDSDDFMPLNRVEKQLHDMLNLQADLGIGGFLSFDSKQGIPVIASNHHGTAVRFRNKDYLRLIVRYDICFGSIMFRKQVLKEYIDDLFDELHFSPDFYIFNRAFFGGSIIIKTKDTYCGYRIHSNQMSEKFVKLKYVDFLKLIRYSLKGSYADPRYILVCLVILSCVLKDAKKKFF